MTIKTKGNYRSRNRQAERRARAYWLDREGPDTDTTPLLLARALYEAPLSETPITSMED